VPEAVWTRWQRAKFPAPVGNRNPVVQVRGFVITLTILTVLHTIKFLIGQICQINGSVYKNNSVISLCVCDRIYNPYLRS
jgi:hypothetical protein